jgi:hypothetical protein
MYCISFLPCIELLNVTKGRTDQFLSSDLYTWSVSIVCIDKVTGYSISDLPVLLVDRSWQDAPIALWTFIATSFGLTIAAIVQQEHLTLFQALQVSNLVWFDVIFPHLPGFYLFVISGWQTLGRSSRWLVILDREQLALRSSVVDVHSITMSSLAPWLRHYYPWL